MLVLHHPTTIQVNYQPMVHARAVRQSARILRMTDPLLRTGDRALCLFRFMYRPEFITSGTPLLFREGRTKGVGRIVRVLHGGEAESTVPATPLPHAAPQESGPEAPQNGATPAAGNGSGAAPASTGSASGAAKPARRRAGHGAAPAPTVTATAAAATATAAAPAAANGDLPGAAPGGKGAKPAAGRRRRRG